MNAGEFFEKFKGTVKENCLTDERKVSEVYKDFHDYTRYVTKVIDKILEENFGLKYNNEYYKIDVVGWTQEKNDEANKSLRDRAGSNDLSFYYWGLNVVVEHENQKKEWLDELVKLYYIKCPLKIIITYNYCDKRDGTENYSDINKINLAKDILLKLNNNRELDEQYLIIIGNAEGKKTGNTYTDFDYRGYLIKDESVEIL